MPSTEPVTASPFSSMPSANTRSPFAVRPLVAVAGRVATHTPLALCTAARVDVEPSGNVAATDTAVIAHRPQLGGTPRTRTVDGEPVNVTASARG